MKHFAGDVTYSTNTFIEKNRNEIAIEFAECLRSSSEEFIQNLSSYLDSGNDDANSIATKSLTSMRQSPSKIRRFNGSGESPTKSSSRSNLITPTKQKVTFNDTSIQNQGTNNSNSVSKNHKAPSTPTSTSTSLTTSTPPVMQRAPSSSSSAAAAYLGTATRGTQRAGASPKLQTVKTKSSLLASFRNQLDTLMGSIKNTRSHFIRCIKPNSTKSQNVYNKQLVMSQLRCGGVLGAIQVFRAGFPNRLAFNDFVERYSVFVYVVGRNRLTRDFYIRKRQAIENNLNPFHCKKTCEILMTLVPFVHIILTSTQVPDKGEEMKPRETKLNQLELLHLMLEYINGPTGKSLKEGMSMGKKQVFLRASVHEYLESLLYRSNSLVARIMQHNWRFKKNTLATKLKLATMEQRFIYYLVNKFSIQTCRTYAKKFISKLIYFQRYYRCHFYRRRFLAGRKFSTWVAAHYRGRKVRAKVRRLRHEMAKRIQKFWREYHLRCLKILILDATKKIQFWYRTILHQRLMTKEATRYEVGVRTLIKLQSYWRGQLARKIFTAKLNEHVRLFIQLFIVCIDNNNHILLLFLLLDEKATSCSCIISTTLFFIT